MIASQVITLARSVLPLFFAAHLTMHLSTGILMPILPVLRDHFELNYFQAGLLVSVFTFTNGFFQLPMGRLADQTSKKAMLLVCLIGVAITAFLIGLSFSYYQLLLLLVVMGVFASIYHPTASSFLSQFFPRETRGRALGLHIVGGNMSFMLTPLLVGLILQFLDWRWTFLLLGLPALVVCGLFWKLVKKSGRTAEAAPGEKRGRMGLMPVIRIVGLLIIIALFGTFLSNGVVAFLPLFLVDKHQVAPPLAAVLVGFVFGAGIIGSPLAGALSDRLGRKPVILGSVVAAGPLLLLLTLLPLGVPLILVFVLFGIAMTSRMPVMESFILDNVPVEQRATALGAYFFLALEANSLAAPVVGFSMDLLGLSPVFTGLAIFALLFSLSVFVFREKILR